MSLTNYYLNMKLKIPGFAGITLSTHQFSFLGTLKCRIYSLFGDWKF